MTTVNARDQAWAGGVRADGVSDDTAALNAALAAAGLGGTVVLPAGTILAGDISLPYRNMTINGNGIEETILKARPASLGGASYVLKVEGLKHTWLSNFTIDGNAKASKGLRIASTGSVTSELNTVVRVGITNCSTGLEIGHPLETTLTGAQTITAGTITVASTTTFQPTGSFMARDPSLKTAIVSYTGKTPTTFTGCTTGSAGSWASGSVVYPNNSATVGTYDQVDKNLFIACIVNACNTGVVIDSINAQQQVFLGGSIGGDGVGNVNIGIDVYNGSLTMIGSQFQTAGTTAIRVSDITIQYIALKDVIFEGHTIDIDGNAQWPLYGVHLDNCVLTAATNLVKMGTPNAVLKAEQSNFATGSIVGSASATGAFFHDEYNTFSGGATVSLAGANSARRGFSIAPFAGVTAAATITIPFGCEVAQISGATTINAITAGYPGQKITLYFLSTPTVGHNVSNIFLNGAVNFVATANDTLSLMSTGANWYEIGRAVI